MSERLSHSERHELAGRARTLHERLVGPPNTIGAQSQVDPDEFLAEWEGLFTDERSFDARLANAEFTRADVRKQVAATCWPLKEPLPAWIDEVDALLEHFEADARVAIDCPAETVFVELLASIATFARDQLSIDGISDAAIEPLVKRLVERLESVSKRALYVEFKSFVEHHDPELARTSPDDIDNRPTRYYDAFIDAMAGHGLRNLFLEYPVLARHIARLTTQWVDAVEEACRRLQHDGPSLQRRFDIDGPVTLLEPLGDETHAGGRIPIQVSFRSGAVIYKPRSVDSGVIFHDILTRLGARRPGPSFTKPNYLRCDGYGWMEVVEYEVISSETAVDRYYERVGSVLCVAYVLNFVDCHLENLIVSGDEPVIVDGETIFHPFIDPQASIGSTELLNVVNRSVLLTNLLPWSVGAAREDDETLLTSMAGIGTSDGTLELSSYGEPIIRAVNTDVMSVEEAPRTVDRRTNTPSVDGEVRPPDDHLEAIVRGFERTYETVRELHEQGRFLTDIVDSERLKGAENRLVFRSTMEYGRILEAATNRGPLGDGVRFTLEMERLVVPFFDSSTDTERYWPLYTAERTALKRLDVPRFTCHPDQLGLYHDGRPLSVDADMSGFELCRQRLDTMDNEDLCRQTWLIRRSFRSNIRPAELPPPDGRTPNQLCETAVDLFAGVIDAYDGAGWVSMYPDGTAFTLVPAGPSLYYGRTGIALSAAGLYRVTGEERYRAFVAEALNPVIEDINTVENPFDSGGLMGLGSVLYALSVAAELLEDETYRASALAAARLVDHDTLMNADAFGVMEGTAGTLLGLLALYDRFGDDAVITRAITCGEHLLNGSFTSHGYRAWEYGEARFTGFAHGSSGIAYALARLGVTADESKYVEATHEALSFESELYSPARTNWARSTDESRYQDRWCHGRAGIALSRIGIGRLLDDKSLLSAAETALSATDTATPAPVDHVCCGNFGRVEALLVGSLYTDVQSSSALELATRCLEYRERTGSLSLPGHTSSFVNPTFMNGLSGVSYTLLRLAGSSDLPCVLLLE